MSGKFELVADALATLRQHGLAAEIEPGNGSHRKIRFVNANGSKCLLIVPMTSGSWRANRNNRAELQRLLRRPAR
jgi:hypothetical protein